MKKKTTLLAIAAAGLFLFSGCSAMVPTSLSANWLKNPTAIDDPSFYERLEYDVSFNNSLTHDAISKITVDPEHSSYVQETEFLPTWSHLGDGSTCYAVYHMKAELTLSATYTYVASNGAEEDVLSFGGQFDTESSDADDPAKVVTEVWFYSLGNQKNLQPLYSKSEYYSYSPAMNGKSVQLLNYGYVIDYGTDCKSATVTYTDHWQDLSDEELRVNDNLYLYKTKLLNTASITFKDLTKQYTCIDKTQLLFAARGIDYSANSSNTLTFVSGETGKQNVTLSCSEVVDAPFTFALDADQASEQTVRYANVSLTIASGGSNVGTAHTMLIAQKTSDNNSPFYALPLQIQSPFGYNLGTLVYKLSEATHTR